jgi:hypothetical protein
MIRVEMTVYRVLIQTKVIMKNISFYTHHLLDCRKAILCASLALSFLESRG